MYFFVFIILILILIPSSLDKKYKNFMYIKIFLTSIIYFYCIHDFKNNILSIIITILCFSLIIYLIHQLLKSKIENKEEDNSLYALAHEIKNPLAVCKGYLDMIDNIEKFNKYLPIIKNEMNRSLNIMDDYLDLKRIKLKKDLMDFTLLVDDIKETISIILGNNDVDFKINNLSKEVIIDGDYDKLKQVLINLIKNSYEAESNTIKIDVGINNGYLKVKIIDDGKGISKTNLDSIGNLFFTTKVYGTGIGVSMSKEIIKLHNGELTYKSVLNKGTIATIILPIKYIF